MIGESNAVSSINATLDEMGWITQLFGLPLGFLW
jgi:hypothetical protein